ncbi:tRNA lysidine(34) synthetase TilS [Thiomicrorhabdus hydrogeniphila]
MTLSNSLSNSSVTKSVNEFLPQVPNKSIVFIAFSGGLDSTVLLHSINQQSSKQNKQLVLVALYVDHGLQAESKEWFKFCQAFCQKLSVEFHGLKVTVKHTQRKGVEAVARALRYQAIFAFIDNYLGDSKENAFLLTGHHQRDQAETVLLNLFRGAGVNGLSAMLQNKKVTTTNNHSVFHSRPILHVPYSAIEQYAKVHSLSYVTDKTNFELNYKRNVVRHTVLPKLNEVWPHAQSALDKTALHLQEASELLDIYAKIELSESESSNYFFSFKDFIEFSWVRQKNTLRYWFKIYWPEIILSQSHYDWIKESLMEFAQSQNHNFCYELPQGVLRVYQNRLYYLKNNPNSYCFSVNEFDDYKKVEGNKENGNFCFNFNLLNELSNVKIRSISQDDLVHRKALKRFFQDNKIPVWERKFWPVLLVNEKIVSVLGCNNALKTSSLENSTNSPESILCVSHAQRISWMGIV